MEMKQNFRNPSKQDIVPMFRFACLDKCCNVKRFFNRRVNKRSRNELRNTDLMELNYINRR